MQPRITLIAAMARDRVIGRGNALPWRLPADLRHFRQKTLGKPALMGRKTWESLNGPLPGRRNIVITRDPAARWSGCETARDIAEAVERSGAAAELMVIGGASIYTQLLPRADRMELTLIDAAIAGDAFFPHWNADEWRETAREAHPADEENRWPCAFVTLQRIDARRGAERL